VCKGWLRASLRKTNPSHPHHRDFLPYRPYTSDAVEPVELDRVYTFDIELWPTNVVVAKAAKLVLEVAAGDTQGCGIFGHTHPEDRPVDKFHGWNNIHIGPEFENILTLPIIT
jgi:X-Pro dipeptidyl-peptidase C-terminal non-catalytic domain